MSSISARGCNRFGATIAGCLSRLWYTSRRYSLAPPRFGSHLLLWGIPSASSRRWRSKAWGRGAARPPSCCRAAWEVQDGALIAVCAIFGVPAEIALAMALIKRVPDLVLGAPALLGWQALEGRRRVLIAND